MAAAYSDPRWDLMSPASVLKLDAGCSLLMREQARFDRGGIDGLAFDSLSAEAAESCSAMLWAPRPEFHSLQTTPARGLCAGMSSFERHGVHVTVLIVPPTDTAIIAKLGLDPTTMPMKPMSTKQCVSEALQCLARESLAVPLRGDKSADDKAYSHERCESDAVQMIEQTLAKRTYAQGRQQDHDRV
jgi:hypothetical protein